MPQDREPIRVPAASVFALMVATIAVLGLPAFAVVADALATGRSGGEWRWLPWMSLVRTAGWSALIGGLAAALGLPLAWACRNARTGWLVLLLAPAAFPSFLAYSGWGMLRAPLTVTGDFIGVLRDRGIGRGGWEWLPGAVDTALAVGGLALWAAPLAAMAMLAGVRGISDETLDASRLETAGARRAWLVIGSLGRPIVFGALAVGALTMGSAVPLHLARVETASIVLWAQLDLTPPDGHWRVWVAAWPMVAAAALLAWSGSGLAARSAPESAAGVEDRRERAVPRLVAGAALVSVGLGTLIPMAMYVVNLRSAGAVARYWRDHSAAVAASVTLAACSACVAVVLAMAAWHAASNGRGALTRRVAAVWTFAGLLPGVMVGSAVARGFALVDAWVMARVGMSLGDTVVPILAGHAARYGFVALWIGLWLAESEPRDLRDQRRLDGAESGWAWFRASAAGSVGSLAGVGAAALALSLHEIESSVLTLWPGGSLLARVILNDLHFFRTQELAAGVVVLAGLFTPPAAVAAVLIGRKLRR